MRAHPEDHPGHEDHGDGADDGLHRLLLGLREALLDRAKDESDGDAQADARRDADPQPTQARTVAAQEGGEDRDDQRGFEPLTETDDEGGQHTRRLP